MRGLRRVFRGLVGVALVATAVSGAVQPAQAIPAAVPDLPTRVVTSDATRTSMHVSWTAPASDGGAAITDYTIEYRKVGQTSWSTVTHAASTATSITVSGLAPDSTYAFRVAAVNAAGTGPWSGQESTSDAGGNHSCAVMGDGTVTCWGRNYAGQLGNNTITDSLVPVPVSGITGLTPALTAVSVSTGDAHSCAFMADGTITCWGYNFRGQLGNNSTTNSAMPVPVSGITGADAATTAVSLISSDFQSCAVMADGTITCWGMGSNGAGQSGDSSSVDSSVPLRVPGITGADAATTALSVSIGFAHSCAVMANGTITCWGDNEGGQLGDNSTTVSYVPVLVSGITGADAATTALSVSAGGGHSCALMADGTITCWGSNSDGQLGDNSTTNRLVPLPVSGITGADPATTALSVSAGGGHSCALMADGTITCWGSNSDGQLGDNSTTNRLVPVPVSGITGTGAATTAIDVRTGYAHSCALMADGTATCWGNNWAGQLGDDSTTDRLVPVPVSGITGVSAATSVQLHAVGRTLTPTPSAPWHVATSNATSTSLDLSWTAPDSDGGAAITDYTIEYRKVGESSWSTVTHAASTATSITVSGLAPDSTYVFRVAAVKSAGTGPWSRPESTSDTGGLHSCAVMGDGTVTCWGLNSDGQLGDNSITDSLGPVPVSGITGLTPASTAVSVSTGYAHSCALMADGTITCWGSNYLGRLGDNSTTPSLVPVPVSGITGADAATTAVSVSAGDAHSCAVMGDGAVTCWGYNGYGQLGDNSTVNGLIPAPVPGITGVDAATTALSVSTGSAHSCAAMRDGTVTCWGWNGYGQLGDTSTTNSLIPVSVSGITGADPATTAVSVSAGNAHSCALMADGTITCWGLNDSGQVGDSSTTNSPIPVPVSGITGADPATTALSVSTGGYHSCAVMADGTATCWGSNTAGQLGDGSTTDSLVPVSVAGVTGADAATTAINVSTSYSHSCAVMANGTATCWGDGGALGNGSPEISLVPAPVSGITGVSATTSVQLHAVGRTLPAALPDVAPGAPRRVATSNATSTSLDVSWTAPDSDGGAAITDYTIEYRKVGESSWSTVTHAASTATSITVSGLAPDSTYVFRVAAVNSAGTGPWSGQEPTLDAGDRHACAVIADGTTRCWGSNRWGQLGDNSTTDGSVPVPVSGITGSAPASTAVNVSAGNGHSCALMANGTIMCWGWNGYAQLGVGSTTNSLVPVPVSGITGADAASTAVSVSAGSAHSCAVMADGTVTCWGWNLFGQLGDNSTTDRTVPVQVTGITGLTPATTALSVSAGEKHSCAVMADGTATCWGDNGLGQLGNNSNTASPVPVLVSGITGTGAATTALSVSTGFYHSCAAMADGTATCWGWNGHGQLGNDSTTSSSVPVPVSGITGGSAATTALSISAGGAHSCAVMADGTATCWGWNYAGELGDNSYTERRAPALVSGITGADAPTTARSVSAGGGRSCAVMTDGTATCWGDSTALGNGSSENSLVPVQVSGLSTATSSFGRTLAAPRSLPSRPRQVIVTGRDADSIAIRWNAPADKGGKHINYYRVSYRPEGSTSWSGFVIVPYSQLHLRVRSLRAGMTYEFQVQAHNANGLGDRSRVVTETVPVRASAPTIATALWNSRVITLTWRVVQTPAHSAVTAYVMSCQTGTGETFRTRVAPDQLTASVRVPTRQLYSCRVAAVTDAGRGVGSQRVKVSARIQDGARR